MEYSLDEIGHREFSLIVGFLAGVRLFVAGLRGLLIPAYYSASGVEGPVDAKFAGIWYLFGDPRAEAVFYTYSVLLVISFSVFTYVYREKTNYTIAAVALASPIIYTGVVREKLQSGLLTGAAVEILFEAIFEPILSTYILLVLYVILSYRGLNIRQFGTEFSLSYPTGSAHERWDLLGRGVGYTLVVIGLLLVAELLTGFPGVLFSPVEPGSWGVDFVRGTAENPGRASELLTTATVLSLVVLFVFYVVRDGTLKTRWSLTVLGGITAIPVFWGVTDTTAAIASGFCLLLVSTTAFTFSWKTSRERAS